LAELVEQVLAGQEVIIANENVPVVRLVAIDQLHPVRVIGTGKGLVRIGDDFDAPIEGFGPHER
jgi:antitoxin (DNA-binding transcriptional repressor) of toxin-antitoxin stability system